MVDIAAASARISFCANHAVATHAVESTPISSFLTEPGIGSASSTDHDEQLPRRATARTCLQVGNFAQVPHFPEDAEALRSGALLRDHTNAATCEFQAAIENDDPQALLDANNSMLRIWTDASGRNIAHRAAEQNKPRLLAALPQLATPGVTPTLYTREDCYGDMPVERAARLGNASAVAFFLQQSAVIEKIRHFKKANVASQCSQWDAAKPRLIQKAKRLTRLNHALVASGESPPGKPVTFASARALYGSVLHTAIAGGDQPTVAAVLNNGGQELINSRNLENFTPLSFLVGNFVRDVSAIGGRPHALDAYFGDFSTTGFRSQMTQLFAAHADILPGDVFDALHAQLGKLNAGNAIMHNACFGHITQRRYYGAIRQLNEVISDLSAHLRRVGRSLGRAVLLRDPASPERYEIENPQAADYAVARLAAHLRPGRNASALLSSTQIQLAAPWIDTLLANLQTQIIAASGAALRSRSVHELFMMSADLDHAKGSYSSIESCTDSGLAYQQLTKWRNEIFTKALIHNKQESAAEKDEAAGYLALQVLRNRSFWQNQNFHRVLAENNPLRYANIMQFIDTADIRGLMDSETVQAYVTLDQLREKLWLPIADLKQNIRQKLVAERPADGFIDTPSGRRALLAIVQNLANAHRFSWLDFHRLDR